MREALRALLERYRHWPHAPRDVTPQQIAAYALSTIPASAELIIAPDAGTALYETPWDTRKLGVRAGRVALVAPSPAGAAPVVAETLARAEAQGFGYLITRVDANDLAAVQTLEAAGFQIVDAILSQYLRVPAAPPAAADPAIPVRPVRPDDAAALGAIADLSFHHSRFHDDPFIGAARARRFYHDWVESLAHGLNTLTLVAERDGAVVGFLSCLDFTGARGAYGWGYGRIELVAVHPDARGAGVVPALTARLVAESPALGWSLLGIGTQIGNLAAIKAYQRAGFTPGDAIFTLRWLPSRARAPR
jgi:dTDP-4-amino-4,6-dideoxy-D-galactose acyltransferase